MTRHPSTPFRDELHLLKTPAKRLGYHMPAEWEPQARVWLSPPHNAQTWPGCLDQAQKQFADFADALRKHVEVRTTKSLDIPTNDSWIRDFGPIFVKKSRPVTNDHHSSVARNSAPDPGPQTLLALHDFRFNAWGGKYENRDLDDTVPQHVAKHLALPLWLHDMVLEGGSIDVNGQGSVMTTRQCLLNPNRNPQLTQSQIEKELHAALGTRHCVWLPGGIVGDDTDGHIDDIARFVSPNTIVALRAPADHHDHAMLQQNWQALEQALDQDGQKLNLIPLPVPEPILYNFPRDRFGYGGVKPVPASYANFLISNGAVFVPVFGQKTDDSALKTIQAALPKHRIIPLRAEHLVVGLGAFHCLSQQQPA